MYKKETSDDLRQEVIFDNWGRTVCTYTTNTDSTEVLGGFLCAEQWNKSQE